MKIKTYLFTFFTFILFILLPTKINAANVSYCQYNEDLTLILPVTIKIDATIINLHYPFDNEKTIHETYSYYIYDEASCTSIISVPAYSKDYLTNYNFYYHYPDKTIPIAPISKGSYSSKDMTPPVFNVFINTITVNVNEYQDLEQISNLVTAFDETDGSVLSEITYDNYSDNYNKLGEYSIIFQACDTSSNCSDFLFKIKVIDVVPPVIEGPNKITSYISKPLTISEIYSKLSAIDNYDGDISSDIYLIETNYETNIPDFYYAYFEVKDYSNNSIKTPFRIDIQLVDDVSPTIEGPTHFISKLSNYLDTPTILSNLIVTDNIDKYIYNNLYLIDDTYSKINKTVGTYSLVVGAYDSNGNESVPYHIIIDVIDDIAPIIDGERLYESYLSSPITLEKIKSSLIATDNHDGNIINKLEIISDTFSNSKENIGVYNILFIVKDSSNNSSAPFSVEVIVYDDIAPYIEGNNYYSLLLGEKIDVLSIRLSLNAYDNIDGNISSNIVLDNDTYSENYAIAGTYYASFYVVDLSGNFSALFKVKITVNENLNDIQKLENSYIHLSTSTLVSETEMLNILGLDTSKFLNITPIENSYAPNYNIDGEYIVTLELQYFDYSKEILDIKVKTYTETENISIINEDVADEEKKETIFNKIISFIKNIFANIVIFFKKLF